MIKKANYKPTLPIFGERFLGEKAKSVRFEEESDSQEQQYDSLYDENMADYFSRPKIKKRLVKLSQTDSNGNPIGNKSIEINAVKKKQLLKEREEVVKKIRMREANRIARLATGSNKVTKYCVACDSHNRMLSYLRTHMCPIHSNVTYQRAKDTLTNSVTHDRLANGDNLAKLEVENKTLKNLWYNEVLRMEEESLQQQLDYEKGRLQKVLLELKKLKQQKEAIAMENLDQIKINLYSKIKRRLGLQALLTTIREVEDGNGNSVHQDNVYDRSPRSQPNGLAGPSFQYLLPSTQAADDVRPSSAPVRSQQVTNKSDLLLHQPSFQHDEQLKKGPSSSRGYRSPDNRGPYSQTPSNMKQTANISPLVNSVTSMPQQFSITLKSNSNLANEPPINKEDVDDDTMPLDEAEAMLEGLSSNETSYVNMTTSDEPVALRNRIPARRQAYSVTAESALTPRPIIPTLHSIPTISAKAKQSSEKRVNFMIDFMPPASKSDSSNVITEIIENARKECETTQPNEANDITEIIQNSREQCETAQQDEVNITEIIQNREQCETAQQDEANDITQNSREQCETIQQDAANDAEQSTSVVYTADNIDAKSAEKTDDPIETNPADTAETENDPNATTDLANEQVNVVTDNQNFEQPQSTSQLNIHADGDEKEMKKLDLSVEELIDVDPRMLEELIAANKPPTSKKRSKLSLKKSSSMKAGKTVQPKKVKSSTSVKKLTAKTSKQFDPSTKAKNSTTAKPNAKQPTSKKPNKMEQDWKKTILQKVQK